MRYPSLLIRLLGVAVMASFMAACEGPNWQKDSAGGSIRLDDWTPIETSQLAGNLAAVFSGLPLTDAKRALRDNAVEHDVVTITGRGLAVAERTVAPNTYFGEHAFSQLRSREAFETWVRGNFPQAKEVEFIDIIPVTHPTLTTRGLAGTVMVTNQQDRKFRCALAYTGYGGPKLSETSTDIFRLEEFKSALRIRFCTVGGTATSLNQRMQRVLF